MTKNSFSPVTPEQILHLEQNRCRAADWNLVRVSEGFREDQVFNTAFKGAIQIGRNCTIESAHLEGVSIGDNCTIQSVGGAIVNTDIADNVTIINVGSIDCTGESTFGHGQEVAVLNESGGRECKITRKTTSQVAYLTATYRHEKKLSDALSYLADKETTEVTSSRASIGSGARIVNTLCITNVIVGPGAIIEGAQSLTNGYIDSAPYAATRIGDAVIAKDFIVQKGACVGSGTMLSSCLIGEAARIGKQFSAENSLLFANSEGFHSEICSVFGGPYTVTHHRSTLLIAGMLSFYNAGSGTNQSNHMYKLGPLHQGIMERGCKTGSSSYLLWPSRIGAFTSVMGKHASGLDTSDFPFSYLSEVDGRSVLIPGMTLTVSGTIRDSRKWVNRDGRKWLGSKEDKGCPHDLVTYDILTPYTGQKMIRGMQKLKELQNTTDRKQTYAVTGGASIKRMLLKYCAKYYQQGIDKYFGDIVVRRLTAQPDAALEKVLPATVPSAKRTAEWIDMAGLICPQSRANELCSRIADGQVDSLDKLYKELASIASLYGEDEWAWFQSAFESVNKTTFGNNVQANVASIVEKWQDVSTKMLRCALGDAEKEFDLVSQTAYGIDGHKAEDFAAVRGTFASHPFVADLETEIEQIAKTTSSLLKRLSISQSS